VYAFLEDYFFKQTPETYKVENDGLQCGANKNRSFNDIKSLVNNYFENVTDSELALALLTLCNEPNCLRFVTCPEISQIAFFHCKYKLHGWVSMMYKDSNLSSSLGDFKGYDLEVLEKLAGIKLKRVYFENPNYYGREELPVSNIKDDFSLDNIINKRSTSKDKVSEAEKVKIPHLLDTIKQDQANEAIDECFPKPIPSIEDEEVESEENLVKLPYEEPDFSEMPRTAVGSARAGRKHSRNWAGYINEHEKLNRQFRQQAANLYNNMPKPEDRPMNNSFNGKMDSTDYAVQPNSHSNSFPVEPLKE
jgi:hypothetical protein